MKYKISDGSMGSMEAVISSTGGMVLSLKMDGEDIFFPYEFQKEKARGGCFVCAPWFGSSSFGEKKHGYFRDLEATDITIGATDAAVKGQNAAKLTFEHHGNEKYPWEMSYALQIYVRNRMFIMAFKIQRLDDGLFDRAPINPAFHPYFKCQDASKVRLRGGGEDLYKNFSSNSIISPKKPTAQIMMPEKEISMILSGGFNSDSKLVLWSDAPEKYFCVEPLFKDKELFNTPNGKYLSIGESLELYLSLTIF